MPYVRRVAPNSFVSPMNTLNLLLLSEGYPSEEVFVSDCNRLADALLLMTPFNVTRFQPNWLSIYRHHTPGNTYNSRYDPASHELTIDTSAVRRVVSSLSVRGEDGHTDVQAERAWPPGPIIPSLAGGAVAVLLPATIGGVPASGEWGYYATPESPGPVQSFCATTTDPRFHQVIANHLGTVMGLGWEGERAGPEYRQIPDPRGRFLQGIYVNLLYSADVTTPSPRLQQWQAQRPPSERAMVMQVTPHPHPDTPNYDPPRNVRLTDPPQSVSRTVSLVEGAAGYRQGMYRSAVDCLMRREIGNRSLSLKDRDIPFCVLCERFLTSSIMGTRESRISGQRTLASQTLQYNDTRWATEDVFPPRDQPDATIPPELPVTMPTAGHDLTHPYWTFRVRVAASYGGLTIENLELRGQPVRDAGTYVAQTLEYRDLAVTLSDGSVVAIDQARLERAFNLHKVQFSHGTNGNRGTDNRYLQGVKLVIEDDLDGRCNIRIEMTLVLKGANNDIDPGGIVDAVKLYPELALTWTRGGTFRARSFRGCVRIVADNYRMPDPPHQRNVPGLFIDTNVGFIDPERRLKSPNTLQRTTQSELVSQGVIPPFPNWSYIFDYHSGGIMTEMEIAAVYGPGTPQWSTERRGRMNWSTGVLNVAKAPRQGAYDSIHMHGYMGDDPHGGALVHAIFCGEACFHLHWRWGALAGIAPLVSNPERFRGWSQTPGHIVAHSDIAAPLIPPNQSLRVAITQPSRARDASGFVIGAGAVARGNPLPPDERQRAVWCTVDISDPGADEPQVIMEHGIGWAFAYHPVTAAIMADFILALRELDASSTLMTLVPSRTVSADDLFHRLYAYMRWFDDGVEQVPQGIVAPALEQL